MLAVADLVKGFGARRILDGLSLQVAAGEYVAIVGESGAGKSTLLNLVAGLDAPDAGQILIDGMNVTHLDENARTRLRRERIGFVFQAFHILPQLTVAQNVMLPLVLLGVPSAE
ncbi:MAG TPA: ATP-binding cassette domain-containing protein, partial [Burkholderiaceae bacterium]|nr:ATP-binding cassette domain-containing protein [Burkholderiaceae bacterium]